MRRTAALALAVLLIGCGGAATAKPTAPETPVPTLDPAYALAGVIEFGADYNDDTLAIIKPAGKFHTTSNKIAYVAHLHGTADATALTLSLTRRASGGAERAVFTTLIEVSSPDFDTFANWYNFAALADRLAGTYVLRVIREGKVLAEGTFELVP
jgi:hypothetical protein